MQTEFIVMDKSAHVPAAARKWGRYRHVAVCEVQAGAQPAMISERAKGVVSIAWRSGAVRVGKTERSAFARALAEARAVAGSLNAERNQ